MSGEQSGVALDEDENAGESQFYKSVYQPNVVSNKEPECESSQSYMQQASEIIGESGIKNDDNEEHSYINLNKNDNKMQTNTNNNFKLSSSINSDYIPSIKYILELIEDPTHSTDEYTVYEISECTNSSSIANPVGKRILCYRRYNNFETFSTALNLKFPYLCLPRLSDKHEIDPTTKLPKTKSRQSKEFLEKRAKELKYYINIVLQHNVLKSNELVRKFIFETKFDEGYFKSVPYKYAYIKKALPDFGIGKAIGNTIFSGMSYIKGFFSSKKANVIYNESKSALQKTQEIDEILSKISTLPDLIKQSETIKNALMKEQLLCRKRMSTMQFIYDHRMNNAKMVRDIEYLAYDLGEIMLSDSKYFFEEIDDYINLKLLDLEGTKQSVERLEEFLALSDAIQKADNFEGDIMEIKTKAANDKNAYLGEFNDELERVLKDTRKMYQNVSAKIVNYLKSLHEKFFARYRDCDFLNK